MTYTAQGGGKSVAKEGASPNINALGRAGGAAEHGQEIGASKTQAIARAIDRAAEDLERELPGAASYVRGASDSLQRASAAIERGNVDELVKIIRDAARSQPVAVFSAATIAGFALSRLLRSSGSENSTLGGR
ncbi:MAG: hypothetical protein CTY15_11475 [Methylocystis sp.]|nr:MAG: hypothetical protein CTY15_11475 [Methylocystis sp.]